MLARSSSLPLSVVVLVSVIGLHSAEAMPSVACVVELRLSQTRVVLGDPCRLPIGLVEDVLRGGDPPRSIHTGSGRALNENPWGSVGALNENPWGTMGAPMGTLKVLSHLSHPGGSILRE